MALKSVGFAGIGKSVRECWEGSPRVSESQAFHEGWESRGSAGKPGHQGWRLASSRRWYIRLRILLRTAKSKRTCCSVVTWIQMYYNSLRRTTNKARCINFNSIEIKP
jgi:hypothetical protein